ncbi:grasp-with-spasm system A modified peptide [Psychroserpens sp. MEBiC05023]
MKKLKLLSEFESFDDVKLSEKVSTSIFGGQTGELRTVSFSTCDEWNCADSGTATMMDNRVLASHVTTTDQDC